MNFWENLKQDLKGRGPILDEGQYAGPQPSGELSITEAGPGALSDPNFQEDDGRKPLPKYGQRHLWAPDYEKYSVPGCIQPTVEKAQKKPVRKRETRQEREARWFAYLEKERAQRLAKQDISYTDRKKLKTKKRKSSTSGHKVKQDTFRCEPEGLSLIDFQMILLLFSFLFLFLVCVAHT